MTFATLVEALAADPLAELADFDRGVALDAGLDPARVREWATVHDVYFGPTKFTKQQRFALAAARGGGLSLDQLVLIERYVGNVDDAAQRWSLRRELLRVRGNFEALRRAAKNLVPAREPEPPRRQTRFTRSRRGMRSVTITDTERQLADFEYRLSLHIDPDQPAAPQMNDAFWDIVEHRERSCCMPGGEGEGCDGTRSTGCAGGVARAVPRPTLLIPIPDWVKILRGEGDEVILGLTDATTMTGAEFLAQFVANGDFELEAAVFHPQEGPVNLYRVERFANQKQRDLVRATMPVCPVPGCRHGADSCQIHHVTAWKHGGKTNLGNLAPLCQYHNRTNDDDYHAKASAPTHGRGTHGGRQPRERGPRNAYARRGQHARGRQARERAPRNAYARRRRHARRHAHAREWARARRGARRRPRLGIPARLRGAQPPPLSVRGDERAVRRQHGPAVGQISR